MLYGLTLRLSASLKDVNLEPPVDTLERAPMVSSPVPCRALRLFSLLQSLALD
jgi:hypothetical protein